MKRTSRVAGYMRMHCVTVAAVTALVLGAAATSAHAERVDLSSDSEAVELGQATNGQEDAAAEESGAPELVGQTDSADQPQQGEANGSDQSDAAGEGPKADPQLDIKGPKVDNNLDIKGPVVKPGPDGRVPKIDPPGCVREYVDESGTVAPHKRFCKELSSSTTGWLPLKAGWYCFSRSVDLSGRAAIEGDVKIILCDDARVNWKGGLHLLPGSKLTIYGQKEGTGELVADASDRDDEAGIGGNQCESGTEVVICGGHVTAKAGEDAAGIGGGGDKPSPFQSKSGGGGAMVTIYGGEVRAYGNDGGDGIGAGQHGRSGSGFTMYGGKVYAKAGGYYSNGIRARATKAGDEMRILGGEVEVEVGSSGYGVHMDADYFDCRLIIENAKVTATTHGEWGCGVGASSGGSASVVIRNATVTAAADNYVEGIDCYSGAAGDCGITIEGDSVIDAKSELGFAIDSRIGSSRSAKIDIADHLDVFSLDEGGKKAEKELRAEYCKWRKHVRIQAGK